MKKFAIVLVAMMLAAPIALAGTLLYENFEAGLPSGWIVLSGDDAHDWTHFSNSHAYGGTGFMGVTYSSSSTAGDDYLITPQLSINEGDYLGFWAKSISQPGDQFDVKLSTTGTDKSDFDVTLGSGTVNLVYTGFSYDLSAYAGQNCYLAIVMTHSEYYLCVDDVEVGSYDPVATEEASWSSVKALFR